MKVYLGGWRRKNEVYIPLIQNEGFSEDMIIRRHIPPVAPQPDLWTAGSFSEEDETVLVQNTGEAHTFLKRKKNGEVIEIFKPDFVIGKSEESDYMIKDNPTISRKHVRITRRRDGYWIEDLQSANHSYLNGRKITEKIPLLDGMTFCLSSDEEFVFMVRRG
ncbi:MAG: FHA domain-containing protein [Lachnospiraceae bacterium]|nr:FHA domain-containing protein [Lachnospiraceae bacterium]